MTEGKDNCWSVVILLACISIQIIVFGLILCFGIYFVELLEYFDCPRSQVAAVGSIAYGTKCLTGLLSSMLYRKFGCRPVVMIGGVISCLGCVLSYFATDLTHLYLTYGLINGFGLGLVYNPTLGILPDYFDKYRYFATAFATVGSALGTLLFQPIFLYMIENYTWQGSMLINGGIALQITLCGSLMKSRTVHPNKKWSKMFELSLLRDYKFLCVCLNCVLWGGAVFTVFSMANSLVMTRGFSKRDSTFIVVVIGCFNALGRLSSSFLGHWECTNRPLLYCVSTLLFAGATLSATLAQSFLMFCVTLGMFGYFFGVMLAQLAGVIMTLFGTRRLITGLGYTMFSVGIGGLSIPPLAAWIVDETGQVDTAYYAAGGAACISAVMCIPMLCIHKEIDVDINDLQPLSSNDLKS